MPPSSLTLFPSTQWTLLQRVREGSAEESKDALETLCRAYWRPLYCVARSRHMTEHDAQDAVQGFFESLLRRETFAKADENLGKLRQLLLRAFEHFCAQQWNRANRMKRGGHVEHMDLGWLMDTGKAEQQFLKSGSAELSIEALYNREWANALLERSLASMQADYQKKGWSERYDLLVRFLLGNDDAGSLEQLASGRGVTSNSLRVTLHRMRAHYRQHVERELASTLDTDNPQVIREELVELFNAYSDHV